MAIKTDEEARQVAEKLHIEVDEKADWGHCMAAVFEAKCEEHLIQPTIVMDHPKSMNPLCKTHRANDRLVEQFEPYINGKEMGTGQQSAGALNAGMQACKLFALGKGWRYRSRAVTSLAMGSYNKKFEPSTTGADWLTKDKNIVDWYTKEPRCSFMFTLNGFYNMFNIYRNLNIL